MKLVAWKRIGSDYIMVVETGRWFWKRRHAYRGECTIWDRWPSGRRCGHLTAWRLLALWKRVRWGCDDEKYRENAGDVR